MVLLSTSESFIEFYVRQLNAFSVHLYRSAKFIASHQDIQAMKSLKQAFVEYENDHPLTYADHGIKPVIVAHWNAKKNAQDVLQSELSVLRYPTSKVSANRALLTERLNVMLNGAIRCFKAAEVVRKKVLVDKAGVMKRNLTRYKIYDELNRVGTVRDIIFRLAREFDPDVFPSCC